MKKIILSLFLSFCLLLSGCSFSGPEQPSDEGGLTIVATTYPVYLFTSAVTEGVEGVEVLRLVNQQTSCLHDYTLTVTDMKTVEKADVVVMNGAGLEDFLSDALASSPAEVIDCSAGIDLLPLTGHEGHDHGEGEHGHFDPHFWLDPSRAAQMVRTIRDGLSTLDQANAQAYTDNSDKAEALLAEGDRQLRELLCDGPEAPEKRELITFHEGFAYFAEAYDLHILKAIEEEEGSEASAHEIKEVVELVQTHQLPVIFTELNGPDATAKAIQRETGVAIGQLTMAMSGEGNQLSHYLDALMENAQAIVTGFSGEEAG